MNPPPPNSAENALPFLLPLTLQPDLGVWVGWRQAVANSEEAVTFNLEVSREFGTPAMLLCSIPTGLSFGCAAWCVLYRPLLLRTLTRSFLVMWVRGAHARREIAREYVIG